MIIFAQIALILAVLVLIGYFLGKTDSKSSALKKVLVGLLAIVAIIFIIFPGWADQVANFVGIGRGADLVFYSLVVIVAFQTIHNSILRKEAKKREAKIIRRVSLLQKQLDELRDQLGKK